jgi:3-deoxy-D-manno-octulosonic-acid transferase
MFRKMLKCFTHLYVQDEASRELLGSIGIKNVTVAGDTRFDRVTDIMRSCTSIAEADAFVADGRLTIVAGSTWPPDEENLLPYFNAHPEIKLIIAPHEVEPERIAGIEKMLKRKSCRLSTATVEEAASSDCIIVDCFGKLSSLYTYGRIAYVGGGFGVGIHNINEAAVYGMPVVFGPKYHKFKEAFDLIAAEGAFSYETREAFNKIMDKLIGDPTYLAKCGKNAADYIKSNLGATQQIYNDLITKLV